jgi:hypothetical protein
MLGTLTRAIFNRSAALLGAGITQSVRDELWKRSRKEALKHLDREGDRWWCTRFVDSVERRISEDQPHHRQRKKHWKRGPGRKAIWPSQWK